jgi:hypothetical protein
MELWNTTEPPAGDHSQFKPMVTFQNMYVGEGLYSKVVRVPERLELCFRYTGVAKQGSQAVSTGGTKQGFWVTSTGVAKLGL